MSDVYTTDKRTEIMRAVKSKNTKSTELKLITLFKELGIKGWRRTYPLIGKPDFVFPKKRIVVFVDGCFWHGHDCRNVTPSDNKAYWDAKRIYNQQRDKHITATLSNKNWTVIRIWECELKKKNRSILLDKLNDLL